jgi:hypothetical protein
VKKLIELITRLVDWFRFPAPIVPPSRMGCVLLAGWRLLVEFALGHLFIGVKGAGKTALIVKVLNQVWGRRDALIAIDTGDHLAARARARLPANVPVYHHNAVKKTGLGADLAKLMDTELRLHNAAEKLIPSDSSGRNEFFHVNGRQVLIALGQALNHFAGSTWRPGDYTWIGRHRRLFDAVLAETKGAVLNPMDGLGYGRGGNDVWGTAQVGILKLLPYASVCDHLKLHNPLEVARKRDGVVVLEWNDRLKGAFGAVYSLIIDACGEEALAELSAARPIWFAVDELPSLNRMNVLTSMAMRGRKPQVNLMVAAQDIEGVIARYGQHDAMNLLNTIGNKFFLRLGGPTTAEWAAKFFGRTDFIQRVAQKGDEYRNEVIQRYNIEPSEFLTSIPYPDADSDTIYCLASTPSHRGWVKTNFVEDMTFPPPPDEEDCPEGWYYPRLRGEADLKRLNIPLSDPILEALKPERRKP